MSLKRYVLPVLREMSRRKWFVVCEQKEKLKNGRVSLSKSARAVNSISTFATAGDNFQQNV